MGCADGLACYMQFHCSMTMTDTILFVKETKTCHYVMVIHTPRLCGEPGFKTRLEQREEAFIRCREVVDSPDALAAVKGTLPESSYPMKRRERSGVIPPPPPPGTRKEVEGEGQSAGDDTVERFLKLFGGHTGKTTTVGGSLAEKIKQAKQRVQDEKKTRLQKNQDGQQEQQQQQTGDNDDGASFNVIPGEEGEMIIEFLDTDELFGGAGREGATLEERLAEVLGGKLQEALRAAGMEVYAVSEDVEISEEDEDNTEGR